MMAAMKVDVNTYPSKASVNGWLIMAGGRSRRDCLLWVIYHVMARGRLLLGSKDNFWPPALAGLLGRIPMAAEVDLGQQFLDIAKDYRSVGW